MKEPRMITSVSLLISSCGDDAEFVQNQSKLR